jgi:hypothetical protein
MKNTRRLKLFLRYAPNLGLLLLVVVVLCGLVIKKDQLNYYNKKYRYTVQFPKGWVKDYENRQAVSYRSQAVQPVAQEPEAATVIVVNDRLPGRDLTGHYEMIMADLSREGVRILNEGMTAVDLKQARWVEFQDANGLNNHIWYIFLINEDEFMIIQNRVSLLHADTYYDDIRAIADNFRFKR